MTSIVGVDFGTSNVRIAQWQMGGDGNPVSCPIGEANQYTMPAVLAFQRQRSGKIEIKLGEEADRLGAVPGVEVIRNIKRYALTSDSYVQHFYEWDLQQQDKQWPAWFDLEARSIVARGETVPVEKAIQLILKEAISRAGLTGTIAEWRAGCPVSSDILYRRALVSALSELGCSGRIEWISEEPLLLLALGKAIGSLEDGYFIVYDLGGGSFDCAVVEVKDDQIVVLADEGLPALGGMDIDTMLSDELKYKGKDHELRIAKEQLSSDVTQVDLSDGHVLTNDIVRKVLDREGFFTKTLKTVFNACNKARILIEEPAGRGIGGKGWPANVETVRNEVDGVLAVGGPTRMPYFTEKLTEIFGPEKVIDTDELVQSSGRADIADPALTALSHGACFMYDNTFRPLAVDRIPARITLQVTDGHSTKKDAYEPFSRLPANQPLARFFGNVIVRRRVYDEEEPELSADGECTYTVSVEGPDGELLFDSGPLEMRMPRTGYKGPRVDRIRLIIDRLGGVKVGIGAGFTHTGGSSEELVAVILDPPWQPELQGKESLQVYLNRGRARIDKESFARTSLPYAGSLHAAYGDPQRRA